jgi:hypothetical protein
VTVARNLRLTAPDGIHSLPTDSTRRYPLPTFTYFGTYNVAYSQFRQDHFGLPENGAPEAPKHVGASWYFKYMVHFEKCISLVFFHHNLKMHGPSWGGTWSILIASTSDFRGPHDLVFNGYPRFFLFFSFSPRNKATERWRSASLWSIT